MRKRTFFWLPLIALLSFMVSVTAAFAAKDVIYPSNSSAKVDGTVVTTTPNFTTGANGHTTLTNPVYAGDAVSVTATWSIQDKSKDSGTNTDYNRTVVFSTDTSVAPGTEVISVSPIGNCTVTSAASTCTTVINFSAPGTIGTYQVMVTAADSVTGQGSNVRIEGTSLYINFTVAEAVGKLETELIVDQQCFTLNQGDVDLTATLQELYTPTNKIAGATIDFYIDPALDTNGDPTVPSIGSATTNVSGVATLSYNINGLSAGDHNLYAEFGGNANYEASNDSDTLGITYLFLGFQQPINPEGNSIFGGRVIPIKIKLLDYNGYPVTDAAPTVSLFEYDQIDGIGEELEKPTSVSAADTGNIMRYVPEDQQYIYNWDATDLPNGTYAVVVDLGDSATCRQEDPYAIITVSRKGKK